ncbi:hypothetical protein [Roseobacter ponti]|uniref:Uncharacterized protein n=1 Tax=Roseobacter ponti TaxID=1891787 RepID=A0A858T0Z0_9RHOB|nr:hypothetical protein [Roseobacter ponti]QJF52896.1 hypothetical protein G3256_17810 [Roseobacter ponti]
MKVTDYQKALEDVSPEEWMEYKAKVRVYSKSRGAVDPDDISSAAVTKTLSGERPWKFQTVKLEAHLIQTAKSLISSERMSQAVRVGSVPELTKRLEERRDFNHETLNRAFERRDQFRTLKSYDAANGDTLAELYLKILEAVLKRGCKSQKEIAVYWEIPESTFFDRKERMLSVLLSNETQTVENKGEGSNNV